MLSTDSLLAAPYLQRGAANNLPQDLMTLLQPLDPVLQESSLVLSRARLGGNSLRLSVCKPVHCNGGEDVFEPADDVAFNDLGRDICDEGLMSDLDGGGEKSVRERAMGR